MICANPDCAEPKTKKVCPKCSGRKFKYVGLLFHDLRHTGARNLRRAGVAETVIMEIGGWRTQSVFKRYAIVDRADHEDAMHKLEKDEKVRRVQFRHISGTAAKNTPPKASPAGSEMLN